METLIKKLPDTRITDVAVVSEKYEWHITKRTICSMKTMTHKPWVALQKI